MTPFARITFCGLAAATAYGCWTVGQILAPDATSELSVQLRPFSPALLLVAAVCLWLLDKSVGPLIERMSERYFIPERERREFLEKTILKLDELEDEFRQINALAERAISERDVHLLNSLRYKNLYLRLLKDRLNAQDLEALSAISGNGQREG